MKTAHDKTEERSIWQEFRRLTRLWPHLRQQKGYLAIGIILIPIISALEMSLPILVKWTIDEGISKSNWGILKLGATGYLAIVIMQYLSRSGQTLSTSLAVHRMIRDLRSRLIRHIFRLSCSYHDRSLSGTLVTRATSDFDNLSESLNMGVLTSLVDIAVLVGSVVGLFYLNWKLAFCALAVLPVVGFIVARFSRALKKTMLRARIKIANLNAFTQECLYGNSTIKLLAAEDQAEEKFNKLNQEYRKAQMGSVVLDASMFSIIDGITSITIGIVLYFGVRNFGASEVFTAGLMIAFVQYIQQMFEPLKQLGSKIAMLQGAFTSIDRIFGILEDDEMIAGGDTIEELRGAVEFRNVSFSYRKGEHSEPILNDISFTQPPGTSLAIVGATGSGKSTIIKLLTKLYDGYSGEINIDGKNLNDIDGRRLREKVAIVPQDIVLFDGSIAFNIGLDLPFINQAAIEHAAKTVGADKFINRLPEGYDFSLREQGTNLSHGQRQLIAFARALAKNPGMVILDEATSAVDPESEALIQSGIESMLEGHTVVVIAHRLSTIKRCDKIMVVDHGNVIEQGSHAQLLARQGAYHGLYQALN